MILPRELESLDWQQIVRGDYEAKLLDHLQADCYHATSGLVAAGNVESKLYWPFVDMHRLKEGLTRPVWPNDASFAVCLTHDVDQVSKWNSTMHLRRLARQSKSLFRKFESRAWRGFQASALSLGRSAFHWTGDDPLHNYQHWLEIEAEVGAKSTFLFLPSHYGRQHYTDGNYRHQDVVQFDGQRCTVAEMMREIHVRGWEVGLHASWASFDDASEMSRQKEQIELAIDTSVQSVRHHHLHFDIRKTPRVHEQAGLQIDSSLGLNDNIGFRQGTCYPTQLHDLERNELLDVWEIPLCIQDRALVETLGRGSEELAMQWGELLAERVKAVGGVLTLLWHPECILIESWMSVYRNLLKVLKSKGAWFGTMAEILSHWREQSVPTSSNTQLNI